MNKLRQLHWPLIIGMGALALIRPFMSITGMMDALGRPTSPLLVTVLISIAWLAIVVLTKVRQPFLTLVFTGVAYGVFTIIISALFSSVLGGELAGPITNPFATVFVISTNTIWGLIVGAIALGIQGMGSTRTNLS